MTDFEEEFEEEFQRQRETAAAMITHRDSKIARQQEEIIRLHQVCRDAYEVWAGSEGIPEPETAAEAYVYQLLIQIRDEVKKGL